MVPDGYTLVSFDVTSLFTKVPLDYTIEIILRKIYEDNLIKTKLDRQEMKNLLYLCTKGLHFSFNGQMYKQVNGVVMGNPLGPVLANIFMVDLENKVVPTLSSSLTKWLRYVDDTIALVTDDEIASVLNHLNTFHEDIRFTHETEENGKIPFLDVLVRRNDNNTISLNVYRKKTCSNIYIHWKSFAPRTWKIGTLEGMIRRAYIICTDKSELKLELSYITDVFKNTNGYPAYIIKRSMEKLEKLFSKPHSTPQDREIPTNEESKPPFMILPYSGPSRRKYIK